MGFTETAETRAGPTRQSIDLTRAHRHEVDDLPAGGPGVVDLVADIIDGETEREKEIRAFFMACPDRLRDALERALSTNGRISKAALARDAGISRPTLYSWLERASEKVWGARRPPFGRVAI